MQLYKHNADTYKELCNKLQMYSKCGIIQCTGSGKGAIASKLILDNMGCKKILLLAPQDSILNNYMRNFGIGGEDNVLCQNYQSICRKTYSELVNLGNVVDLLILDEYHRLGAPEWNRAVSVIMDCVEKKGGKIVGLSATPKRYFENRDMTDELFNGICVEGVDLTAAIKKGILPVFTYIKARYGFTEEVKRYNNYRSKNRSKGSVDENKLSVITNEDFYIRDIVKKETSSVKGCQKWVVFCKNIKELKEMKYNVSNWFDKEVRIFEMHSDLSKEENFKNYTGFCESHRPINVLLTVNKLNEGVHVKGVSGVIMLRETESPIIFLQQLGRALEAGATQRPIIFDFVNNVESLSKYGDDELVNFQLQFMATEINEYAERKAKKDPSKGGKIILKSYCEEIDNILKDIRKVTRVSWLPEEDEVLKQYFEDEKKDIVKRLPGRSWDAIYQRAKNIGLVKSRGWTLKQDNVIRKYYPIEGEGVIGRKELNGRTEDAVKTRASQLGVKKDKAHCWKKEDDRLLVLRYSDGATDKPPIDKMVKLLGNRFTIDQIFVRFDYLGLNKNCVFEDWRNDEDQLLRMLWNNWNEQFTYEDMLKRLGRHTEVGIKARAKRLGLPPIADEYLSEKGKTLREAKKKSGKKATNSENWTKEEDECLIEWFYEYGPRIYEMFPGRTRRAVDTRVYELRIQGVLPSAEESRKNKKNKKI